MPCGRKRGAKRETRRTFKKNRDPWENERGVWGATVAVRGIALWATPNYSEKGRAPKVSKLFGKTKHEWKRSSQNPADSGSEG